MKADDIAYVRYLRDWCRRSMAALTKAKTDADKNRLTRDVEWYGMVAFMECMLRGGHRYRTDGKLGKYGCKHCRYCGAYTERRAVAQP